MNRCHFCPNHTTSLRDYWDEAEGVWVWHTPVCEECIYRHFFQSYNLVAPTLVRPIRQLKGKPSWFEM